MNQSKLFAIAAAAAVMVSCGNKEDGGGSTPLTPEENKEKLDRIGMDVINMINPANHEDFCEAVDHFVEFSDEGNLGDVFHDPNAYSLMASTMQALKTACTKGDISGLLTKTEVTDYIYRAEDYYGVYNYRNGRWTYTEDDSKLEFRYSFNGDDIVATAVASGEESLVSYTDRWTEPGYEDWNGNYHPGEEYEYNYDVYVPEKVEVNFTKNGESLASVTVNTDCQMNDHVNIDVAYAVADMDGYVAVDLDNSNGSASYSLNMGGRNIVTGSTVFSGSDMADPDEVINDPENAVRGAEAEVIILDEARVYGKCTNMAGYIGKMEDLDNEYEHMVGYDYYYTKDYNEESAELFNEYFSFELSYLPGKARVASLFAQCFFDEDYYYWDGEKYTDGGYGVEPILKFDIDESEYSVESYFSEKNFGSIVNSVEDLGEIYEGYFPYSFGY